MENITGINLIGEAFNGISGLWNVKYSKVLTTKAHIINLLQKEKVENEKKQ